MINPEELAVCRKRGHDPHGGTYGWERCKYCGMWTRMVKEEREDDPPENEQYLLYKLQKELAKSEDDEP